jgi:hypothetical protein
MGRSLPLQAAIVVLSAPGLTAELAPMALGPVLIGACDVVAATPGEPGAGAACGMPAAPLAVPWRAASVGVRSMTYLNARTAAGLLTPLGSYFLSKAAA